MHWKNTLSILYLNNFKSQSILIENESPYGPQISTRCVDLWIYGAKVLVDVGAVYARTFNQNGHSVRTPREIDFVVTVGCKKT